MNAALELEVMRAMQTAFIEGVKAAMEEGVTIPLETRTEIIIAASVAAHYFSIPPEHKALLPSEVPEGVWVSYILFCARGFVSMWTARWTGREGMIYPWMKPFRPTVG